MFATFQDDISNKISNDINLHDNDDILIKLYNLIPSVWRSEKYALLAKNCISKYGARLQTIIHNNGDINTKYN